MTNDTPTIINAGHLSQLQEQLSGSAYQPGDDGYDAARMPWNLSYAAQHPALIVEAANAADIVAAINFAN